MTTIALLFLVLFLSSALFFIVRYYKPPNVHHENKHHFFRVPKNKSLQQEEEKYEKEHHNDKNFKTDSFIFYKLFGNGPQKVLFVIGLGTNFEYWHPQIDYIEKNEENSKRYTICVFDNLGSGNSSTPAGWRIPMGEVANAAVHLVQHLGWKEFHLVGQSMGGLIAQAISLELEKRSKDTTLPSSTTPRLQSLTLFNTFTHPWHTEFFQASLLGFFVKAAVNGRSQHKVTNNILDIMFSKEWLDDNSSWEDLQNVVSAAESPTTASTSATKYETNREYLYRRYFEKIFNKQQQCKVGTVKQVLGIMTNVVSEARIAELIFFCPILLIASEKDQMIHPRNMKRLQSLFTNIVTKEEHKHKTPNELRFHWFEGAGHIVNVERRHDVNKLLFEEWLPAHS